MQGAVRGKDPSRGYMGLRLTDNYRECTFAHLHA